jgi:inosine/xanthosine triphosphatase
VIVLLGSTRPAKVDGAREALAAIARIEPRFASPTIHTFDLTTIAPRMPLSEREIVDGARRRALALVEQYIARDFSLATPATLATLATHGEVFAVGLEGGLDSIEIDGQTCWTLQTWAAVSDGHHWGFGAGGALAVPRTVADRVVAGEELGDVIDGLAGANVRGTRGAWGVLTRDLVARKDAFRLAVLAAFAPFFNPSGYESG